MSDPMQPDAATTGALGTWLARHDLVSEPVTVRPIGDGHANITYLVTGADSRRVVVRRPPPPPTPPGANDVLREARIIAAVHAHADDDGPNAVPVPGVLAVAEAGDVLDVPCFAMSYVAGPVVTTTLPDTLATADDRTALAFDLVDTLAALHRIPWDSLGLRGRPQGANLRQRDRLAMLVADQDGAPPAAFADVDAWLVRHAPAESGAALVHNDFRLGNVLLAPDAPRVAAVLDWELAAIGDPLVDLGYLIAAWSGPGGPRNPVQELGSATSAAGFPDPAMLATHYAETTGASLQSMSWYVTLANWKLAVLYEYSRRRYERGDGDPYYAGTDKVAAFLEAADKSRHDFSSDR
ncbi:phosphotransferase family protein [Curtobacterium sp. Leaf261]|uniref:phosphotransferase family protein n=1 Tax=Curtobacterium sp. Leaf261 TaxID=1736311 RepID=UPI0006F40A22|nr:phosphotransferase family protein [Curtobacterium sp. Leaf261]KQO65135.1 phosphotransferase [Curtobacterium sp. Leaf261]